MSADRVFNSAADALNPAEAQRFIALIDQAESVGEGVFGMWMGDRQACMAGVVLAGRLIGWWMFSAPSDKAAQRAVLDYKRIIERAIDEHLTDTVSDAETLSPGASALDGTTRH